MQAAATTEALPAAKAMAVLLPLPLGPLEGGGLGGVTVPFVVFVVLGVIGVGTGGGGVGCFGGWLVSQ